MNNFRFTSDVCTGSTRNIAFTQRKSYCYTFNENYYFVIYVRQQRRVVFFQCTSDGSCELPMYKVCPCSDDIYRIRYASPNSSKYFKYRVTQQVLDGLIGQNNPNGLWWEWIWYPKTTIQYYGWLLKTIRNQKIFKKLFQYKQFLFSFIITFSIDQVNISVGVA